MKNILIGATGFVGCNLREQLHFDALLSSKNIADFKGERVDLAIIAAGDARKWYANLHPAEDKLHMHRLAENVAAIGCGRVLHFSTIDVYASKQGDEADLAGRVSQDAYGGHRFEFEQFVRQRFGNVTTIRLPGLYGPGLKKNIIFDVSQDRDLSGFHPDSTFQWFDLAHLKHIVEYVQRSDIETLNVAVEPVTVAELLNCAGVDVGRASRLAPLVQYDIRTSHATGFGGRDGYLYSKAQALEGIASFLAGLRRAG